MNQTSPVCPNCGQADKTYKVSLLYLESAARFNHRDEGNQPELDELLIDLRSEISSQAAQNQLLSQILQSFSPPPGEKHITRRIHPDTMVIFFSLLALLLLYKIAVSQPAQLPIILILLVGSILAYLLGRKAVVRRYENHVRQEQEENARLETAVTRWTHLYFCSRDKGVFDP